MRGGSQGFGGRNPPSSSRSEGNLTAGKMRSRASRRDKLTCPEKTASAERREKWGVQADGPSDSPCLAIMLGERLGYLAYQQPVTGSTGIS